MATWQRRRWSIWRQIVRPTQQTKTKKLIQKQITHTFVRMERDEIRSNYSYGHQWRQILEPYLLDLDLTLKDIVCVFAIELYKEYVGFLRVRHLTEDRGIWFTEFVKVRVRFSEDIHIELTPVHFRKEILTWSKGTPLMDARNKIA